MTTPAGDYGYSYDIANRTSSVTFPWTGGSVTCTFDAAGRITRQQTPKIRTVYEYDGRSLLKNLYNKSGDGSIVWSQYRNMTYTTDGKRKHIDYGSDTIDYSYDDNGRLSEEKYSSMYPGASYDYTFTWYANSDPNLFRGATPAARSYL